MIPKIRIREIKKLNLENGYLIDGFPSVGFTSAIATESMIHTSKFELGGVIDSEAFPPISVVKDGKPNFPTRIFVNEELKVGIFLSYRMWGRWWGPWRSRAPGCLGVGRGWGRG